MYNPDIRPELIQLLRVSGWQPKKISVALIDLVQSLVKGLVIY